MRCARSPGPPRARRTARAVAGSGADRAGGGDPAPGPGARIGRRVDGGQRGLPVQGTGPVRRTRRRLVLRSGRRDRGLRGATPHPPVPGRRRTVGMRQVVARARRARPGASWSRPRGHGRRAGKRSRCDGDRDPGDHSRTVVVVDQFEELFELGHPPDTVNDLCRTLVAHADGGGAVVIAVRSDRLGELGVDAELSQLVERGLHLVTPLAGDALRRAIEEPAQLAGLRLEHGLVELLGARLRRRTGRPAAAVPRAGGDVATPRRRHLDGRGLSQQRRDPRCRRPVRRPALRRPGRRRAGDAARRPAAAGDPLARG